jgi:hypothetical protein
MINLAKAFLVGSFLFSTFGCAGKSVQRQKEIQTEVQVQPVREMHGGVAAKGIEAILTSKTLTDDQKKKLLEVHEKMSKEIFEIQDETSQLKGVLFETLTTKPYDRPKVKALRKKLVVLNDKKMDKMFRALDKVQVILGENGDDRVQDFYRPFFWEQTHQGQSL